MSYHKIKNGKQNSPSSSCTRVPHKIVVVKKNWTLCARNAGESCRKKMGDKQKKYKRLIFGEGGKRQAIKLCDLKKNQWCELLFNT